VSDFSIDPNLHRVGKSVLAGLYEFRSRGLKALMALGIVAICMIPFSNQIFEFVARPIMTKLPQGSTMIAKDVASPFFTPLKATIWLAVFVSMPAMLYQIWRLVDAVMPARAKHIAPPFIVASCLLFYTGVGFAFFLVLPMAFGFFTRAAPSGVTVMTDITQYLDFTIGMLLAFGLAFQVPIAIVILVWTGLVTRASLKKSRPYVFLGAFVVGMILTPPDVFSQTLLALPMYGLFEGALLFCWRFLPEK
jgi:sec-independent protein translocase protein TatC